MLREAKRPGLTFCGLVQQSQYNRMYAFMLRLLERGTGLTLGPDSDGLLNFCDSVEVQTPEQKEVKAGKQMAKSKGKQKAEALVEEERSSQEPSLAEVGSFTCQYPFMLQASNISTPFETCPGTVMLQSEEGRRPKWQIDIEKLLGSGRLPRDAPLESVPQQLQSHPKRFQLQVGSLLLK